MHKVALTAEMVQRFDLPPIMQAKATDSRAAKFTARHGSDVFELESLRPETLQAELTAAIDSVLDLKAFNAELQSEAEDAGYLAGLRERARVALTLHSYPPGMPLTDASLD